MLGPGEYVPDVTEGISAVQELPPPRIQRRSRNSRARRCPHCGSRAGRYATARRTLQDLGDVRSGRPLQLLLTYSKHHCPHCDGYFAATTSDLAAPNPDISLMARQLIWRDGPTRGSNWVYHDPITPTRGPPL